MQSRLGIEAEPPFHCGAKLSVRSMKPFRAFTDLCLEHRSGRRSDLEDDRPKHVSRPRIKLMRYPGKSMATKSAKAPAKRPQGASKKTKSSQSGTFRKTAKRSTQSTKHSAGRRTTLRVPNSLDTEVSRVSRELGISGNEALVRLAALGAESARREREVHRVIERRHAAVMGPSDADASTPFPSAQEMREAILVDRD